MTRISGRRFNELRSISFITSAIKHAEGSCLTKFGDTHVMCTATIEEKVPPFLRNTGTGWITAEYGMLPRSTHSRMDREAAKGKQSGRTLEIQRLIGRSLRAITDLKLLGERQIRIDCDVLQADGGTRTAAICGSYLALHQAIQTLLKKGSVAHSPLRESVAAISCGIVEGNLFLDLEYTEDSAAEVDANFVMTASGLLVEIQSTAETKPFTGENFQHLLALAQEGIQHISKLQQDALTRL